MHAAPALLDTQRRFLAALYDDAEPGPLGAIVGNGLDPAARLRIYRHSCSETQIAALRTAYPAVWALVGETFFAQTADGYRRAYPSRSGNLQVFGEHFAAYLRTLPQLRGVPYLPDVAKLEWLRQESVLAADAASLSLAAYARTLAAVDGPLRITLHPSVRLLSSRHAVLALWHYALDPVPGGLKLPDAGDRVALWREHGQVAMTALDAASFTCLDALARGGVLDDAHAAACAVDPAFNLPAWIESLVTHGLVSALAEVDAPAGGALC